jgi:immune inhibitor A
VRRTIIGLVSLTLASGLGVSVGGSAWATAPGTAPGTAATDPQSAPRTAARATVHDLPSPLEAKRRELRQQALTDVLDGAATAKNRHGSVVVDVGTTAAAVPANKRSRQQTRRHQGPQSSQYVELAREKSDKIFVVLAEFGNERHPDYPDQDTDPATPGPTVFNGPLHNQIPEPDRSQDNATVWQPDYSADHYRQLYFGTGPGVQSLKTFYQRQSSGRYTVNGEVSDWVKVPYNEARYGRSDGYPCASNVCSNTWQLLRDALTAWVADQQAKGRSSAQIKADLQSYDTWDRYDFDGDGNFNEPDGYIDHFQIVHAGGDQADGDPQQGEDAIWSHRWYAFQGGIGTDGPSYNPAGGTQIGDTGIWVADYTIQPENGGLSVFAHEYGHDLGLPDHYDTAGGPDNAVNWWTLMAQSRASAKGDEGLGTRPADLGAWDKLQLGWLDYEIAPAGTKRNLVLGPHEYNTKDAQGVVVPLPPKEVTTDLVPPAEGDKSWWSGSGNDLSNTLTRQVEVPAGTDAQLSFQANWDIEDCGPDPCDYAFVEVDDGSGWQSLPGSITKADEGNGIDGTSDGWQAATFDLSGYTGQTIGLRFRYQTDGAAGGMGLFADDISLTVDGSTVFTDGAEDGVDGWTADGFTTVGASITQDFDNYYIASYRSYTSYDKYLRTGPYNFGWANTRPDWVEHFPYQDGLLISYWDTSYGDNNESEHPGHGLVLPIDSHPQPIYRLDGNPWRGRIQTYDAPFSTEKADSFTLHNNGKASYVRGQAAQRVFDDRRSYWSAVQPTVGVKVPEAGVRIKVKAQHQSTMKIRISSTG